MHKNIARTPYSIPARPDPPRQLEVRCMQEITVCLRGTAVHTVLRQLGAQLALEPLAGGECIGALGTMVLCYGIDAAQRTCPLKDLDFQMGKFTKSPS